MNYVLVVSGLCNDAFDKLKSISSKKIIPSGVIIARPRKSYLSYGDKEAEYYLEQASKKIREIGSQTDISTIVIYTDFKDISTKSFVERFFPFSLCHPISPLNKIAGMKEADINREKNKTIGEIIVAANRLKKSVALMKGVFSGNNLTPFLLPLQNFQSRHLTPALRDIYENLASSKNPTAIIEKAKTAILNPHPWITPDGSLQRCLCDGVLYFKSPGKARHGRFEFATDDSHLPSCHLNAQNRLGSTYKADFHYDCTPVKGKLKSKYPNCHGVEISPKHTHVNIAPNDCII